MEGDLEEKGVAPPDLDECASQRSSYCLGAHGARAMEDVGAVEGNGRGVEVVAAPDALSGCVHVDIGTAQLRRGAGETGQLNGIAMRSCLVVT